MTQKRKVGPGGGDFALNPNRFSGGGGGGKSIITGKKSTVSKKTKKAPEQMRSPTKKLDHLVERMSRLYGAQEKSLREGKIALQKQKAKDAKDKKNMEKSAKNIQKIILKDDAKDRRN